MFLRTVTTMMSSFWPPTLAALVIFCADLPLIFSKFGQNRPTHRAGTRTLKRWRLYSEHGVRDR